jgi:hypothetical protein
MYKLEFSFSTQTNPPCQNNFGITLAPFKLISSSCSESPPPKKKKNKKQIITYVGSYSFPRSEHSRCSFHKLTKLTSLNPSWECRNSISWKFKPSLCCNTTDNRMIAQRTLNFCFNWNQYRLNCKRVQLFTTGKNEGSYAGAYSI